MFSALASIAAQPCEKLTILELARPGPWPRPERTDASLIVDHDQVLIPSLPALNRRQRLFSHGGHVFVG
jgi:hypothetical protein